MAELLGLGDQPSTLVVAEAGLFASLLLEDFDLLMEVFNTVLLVAIDPTGQANEKKLKMVHGHTIRFHPLPRQFFCSHHQTRPSETAGFSWPRPRGLRGRPPTRVFTAYKDVTYQTFKDGKFRELMEERFGKTAIDHVFSEYDAAPEQRRTRGSKQPPENAPPPLP